jgi:hypothetical protein
MQMLTCLLVGGSLLATSCTMPMTIEEAQRAYSVVKPGQTVQQVIASIGEKTFLCKSR